MNDENTYLYDPNSPDEMERLARQGRMLTAALGLLPLVDPLDLLSKASLPQILDIGSGPGEWALELAVLYPSMQIIGIDISVPMIKHASIQAESQETPNVRFRWMNALKPLDFPDAFFDLINIRSGVGFIPREKWVSVFQECFRVLRPGGILLSIEGDAGVQTYESPNTAQMIHWLCQALFVKGLGFWDGYGSMLGIHGKQLAFFRKVGFPNENIQTQLSLVEASYESPQWQGWLDHHRNTVEGIKPIVCGQLGISKERFKEVLERSFLEAYQKNFCSYTHFLAVSGRKP
ncbi:MAG TPA: methyltransferase domain-containing protein [Ktedonobacteraceae bacterium]